MSGAAVPLSNNSSAATHEYSHGKREINATNILISGQVRFQHQENYEFRVFSVFLDFKIEIKKCGPLSLSSDPYHCLK